MTRRFNKLSRTMDDAYHDFKSKSNQLSRAMDDAYHDFKSRLFRHVSEVQAADRKKRDEIRGINRHNEARIAALDFGMMRLTRELEETKGKLRAAEAKLKATESKLKLAESKLKPAEKIAVNWKRKYEALKKSLQSALTEG